MHCQVCHSLLNVIIKPKMDNTNNTNAKSVVHQINMHFIFPPNTTKYSNLYLSMTLGYSI